MLKSSSATLPPRVSGVTLAPHWQRCGWRESYLPSLRLAAWEWGVNRSGQWGGAGHPGRSGKSLNGPARWGGRSPGVFLLRLRWRHVWGGCSVAGRSPIHRVRVIGGFVPWCLLCWRASTPESLRGHTDISTHAVAGLESAQDASSWWRSWLLQPLTTRRRLW